MTQYLVFAVLGLGNGAVFAALGLALVTTFRSSGVINFATGAIAAYTAYTYALLREGRLLIPVPGLPTSIRLTTSLPFDAACPLALLVAALLGALMYWLVFRPLRSAPATTRAVASIAIMVLIQALLAQRTSGSALAVAPILPTQTYDLGGVTIPSDRVWFAGLILALAIAMSVVLRWTRFGLATRAVAESEKGAIVTGLRPQRIALTNWMLGSVVAGLSGILISPIVPLTPAGYTLFIVPAIAAATAAGLRSLWTAVLVALAIGIVQSEFTYLQATQSWLPHEGLSELVPLVLLLGFLLARSRPLAGRTEVILRSLGRAPLPTALATRAPVLLVLASVAMVALPRDYRLAFVTSIIFALLGLSQVVITGYTGQISLAQLTLAGSGAFALSRFTHNLGIPFPIAPLLAALVAAVIGVIVGLPSLRVRGLSLAAVTLALAAALEAVWFDNPSLAGGALGAPISTPRFFHLDLGVGTGTAFPRLAFGFLCLGTLALTALGVAWLRHSRLGAAMLAVRANERSAAAAGVDVARTKLIAFGISSFIAGLAGSLLAYEQSIASPTSFAALGGLAFFVTISLAGINSIAGGLTAGVLGVGGLVYTLLNSWIHLGSYYDTIAGVALIIGVIANPEGITSAVALAWRRLRAIRAFDVVPASAIEGPTRLPVPGTWAKGHSRSAPTTNPALVLSGLTIRYGSVLAVDDVSFAVPSGSIVGLIGPNGAGKSSLLDAIAGFTPSAGSVHLNGVRLDRLAPYRRAREGLGRSFQGLDLYEDLSVAENVAATQHGRERRTKAANTADVLDLVGLSQLADVPVRELSQGYRQLVSLARAVAGHPKTVLLDEPAAGLDSSETPWLAGRLRALRDAGTTVVLVEHDLDLVFAVCEQVYVLDLGHLIASGSPQQITADERVIAAYLGTAPRTTEPVADRIG